MVGADEYPWDRLVIATGFEYTEPDIPGIGLEGVHYVKNIRRAMEFDKVLDTIKKIVVIGATPLGIEMAGNLANRGLETHLVDEGGWLMSEVADPDIMEPVQESIEEMGATMNFATKVNEIKGENGKVKSIPGISGSVYSKPVAITRRSHGYSSAPTITTFFSILIPVTLVL